MGAPGAMNPTIFGKFLRMLDQIAAEREKEIRILNQIEAVEEQHRLCRKHNQLEQGIPQPENKPGLPPAEEEEAEPPKTGLLWLAAIWYLFGGGLINQKKQGLTAD
jgi:hypothetical protein